MQAVTKIHGLARKWLCPSSGFDGWNAIVFNRVERAGRRKLRTEDCCG
uniref:Uncharacterized protein n=1 Tax=Rhizophora mucronata TaxID=61149 RepID=A0A2P2MC23_RHIMU